MKPNRFVLLVLPVLALVLYACRPDGYHEEHHDIAGCQLSSTSYSDIEDAIRSIRSTHSDLEIAVDELDSLVSNMSIGIYDRGDWDEIQAELESILDSLRSAVDELDSSSQDAEDALNCE